MANNKRMDQILVERGLVNNLEEAKRFIMAGKVRHLGQVVMKASQKVNDVDEITLIQNPKYVSRGGEKLGAAFTQFPLTVSDRVCADVGASTGGFTDCLLINGASRVYSIDVGYGILDWRLRNDPRVVVMERTNARFLASLPEPVEFITVDVSFISLKKILPVISNWFPTGGGEVVVLIKPQFEATREEAARGAGVIRDPEIHQRILTEILSSACEGGYQVNGLIRSPLFGPEGNTEFLAWLSFPSEQSPKEPIQTHISPLF
ncbi:MAG: TlyA family RNA methyltransferase [Anaerolineales bacterium]|nr:TlyA family RNA methyltransferase [Anaerolineales bacterium]